MNPLECSICGIECNSFAGTLITEYSGPLSKEKRHPTSDCDRWIIKYDKTFEILRYCHDCYMAFALKEDLFRLKHLRENTFNVQEEES